MFVYFSNYFGVRPNLHLRRFAERTEQKLLDDDRYDYGNLCLLKLLGFTARELADLGDAPDPGDDPVAFERYRSQLDERRIKLNAASLYLSGADQLSLESPTPSGPRPTRCWCKRTASTSRWSSKTKSVWRSSSTSAPRDSSGWCRSSWCSSLRREARTPTPSCCSMSQA